MFTNIVLFHREQLLTCSSTCAVLSFTKKLIPWIFVISCGSVEALNLSNLSIPEDTSVAWVAQSLEQNGVELKIQQLKSGKSVDEVLEFYRNEWDGLGNNDIPGYVENTLDGWSIISALEGDSSLVVQIRPGEYQATEGFISELNPMSTPKSLPELRDIPLPAGTQTMSTSATDDEIRKGTTLILTNAINVRDNYLFFKDNLPRRGWTYTTGSSDGSTAVLMYSKKNNFCEISISASPEGNTILVVNRASSD